MLLPNPSRLSRIYLSNESITVKTDMMAKIPIVMPSNERNVRNLLPFSELKAKVKLSSINLIRSIIVIQFAVKLKFVFLFFCKTLDLKTRETSQTRLTFFLHNI